MGIQYVTFSPAQTQSNLWCIGIKYPNQDILLSAQTYFVLPKYVNQINIISGLL